MCIKKTFFSRISPPNYSSHQREFCGVHWNLSHIVLLCGVEYLIRSTRIEQLFYPINKGALRVPIIKCITVTCAFESWKLPNFNFRRRGGEKQNIIGRREPICDSNFVFEKHPVFNKQWVQEIVPKTPSFIAIPSYKISAWVKNSYATGSISQSFVAWQG